MLLDANSVESEIVVLYVFEPRMSTVTLSV